MSGVRDTGARQVVIRAPWDQHGVNDEAFSFCYAPP
jgi:hypothetical protein